MFVKIRLENSDKITKIKLGGGETLQELRGQIASKLGVASAFDLHYIDEEKENIYIRDEDDWKTCVEDYSNLSRSQAGSAPNLVLLIKPLSGSASQSPDPHNAQHHPHQKGSSPHYPTPPQERALGSQAHHIVVSAQPVPVPTVSSPAQPVSPPGKSSLFGGADQNGSAFNAVHQNIICDECQQSPLTGRRYKSINRNDFDLCEKCANLPKYSHETFIRIPYYEASESQGIYSPKEFSNVMKQFIGKIKDPSAKAVDEMVAKMEGVFLSADKGTLRKFVQENKGLGYDALYQAYIKKFHSGK